MKQIRLKTSFLLSLIALATSVTANAASCQGGSATICGASIPLSMDMTSIGNSMDVHVPATVLGGSYAQNPNISFTVECVSDGIGGVTYRVLDSDKISCTLFPCQASSVNLCDTSIPVPGGTSLGGVVHLTMPTPFSHNGFTVQCVGSGGNPPAYQVTEHSAVSCMPHPISP